MAVNFIPQITYLSAVKDTTRVAWQGGSLRHNRIDSGVYVWRLYSISVHSVVVTNQVAVSNEGSATQVTLVILTYKWA